MHIAICMCVYSNGVVYNYIASYMISDIYSNSWLVIYICVRT